MRKRISGTVSLATDFSVITRIYFPNESTKTNIYTTEKEEESGSRKCMKPSCIVKRLTVHTKRTNVFLSFNKNEKTF